MNETTSAAIALHGVEKKFEVAGSVVNALEKTDFAVSQGEFVTLLGPSGCGKTTMLRLIAGLLKPSSGQVDIAGRPLWNGDRREPSAVANTGVVFQDANLFPWLNIEENIAMPLRLRGVKRAESLLRARELCRLVKLEGFEQHWPDQLSGGMRQRASIARALSYDPKVLLMDEPFGALDAMTRDAMNVELLRIWHETKKTIVLVTHSIAEAVFLGQRVVLLSPRPGRISEVLSVPFEHPRSISIQASSEFQRISEHLRARLDH